MLPDDTLPDDENNAGGDPSSNDENTGGNESSGGDENTGGGDDAGPGGMVDAMRLPPFEHAQALRAEGDRLAALVKEREERAEAIVRSSNDAHYRAKWAEEKYWPAMSRIQMDQNRHGAFQNRVAEIRGRRPNPLIALLLVVVGRSFGKHLKREEGLLAISKAALDAVLAKDLPAVTEYHDAKKTSEKVHAVRAALPPESETTELKRRSEQLRMQAHRIEKHLSGESEAMSLEDAIGRSRKLYDAAWEEYRIQARQEEAMAREHSPQQTHAMGMSM